MSRTKSSLNGFSFDIIGQIVTQLVLLYLIPQYIVLSSAELYGLWLTINSLIGWMSIADIGIGMALGRKLIYATTQKNNNPDFDKDYATSISTALFSFAISAVVILLVGSLFIAYALTTFKINPTNYIEFKQTFFIALIAASLSLPLSVFPAIVETHLKLSFIRITGTITGLCGHAVGFTLLWLGYGIKSLAIGILCGILLNALANFIYSKKLSGYSIGVQYFSFSEFKSLFAFGGYFQLGRIANTVAVSTDNIVISMLINPASVASYSFTAKLSQLFGIIIASKIPISLLPGITQCFAEGNKTKLQEIVSRLLRILFRISLLNAAIVLFINQLFVNWWVGAENFGGWYLTYVFVYWTFYETLYRGAGALIFAQGDVKNWGFVSVIESVLNIGLSFFLGSKWGLIGIAIATSVSRLLTSGAYLVYFLVKQKLLEKQFIAQISKIFLLSLPSIFCMLLAYWIVPNDYLLFKVISIPAIGVVFNLFVFDGLFIYNSRKKSLKTIMFNLVSAQ